MSMYCNGNCEHIGFCEKDRKVENDGREER